MVRNRPAQAARLGYVATRGAGGRLQVRQRPGPLNALGQVKIEMPNAYSIFLHDTPSKGLFEQERRAFSHGCMRTEHPDVLARTLLA
ncbi:L,D-transpeptidase family protein, partial [Acinetobacter baumannii]